MAAFQDGGMEYWDDAETLTYWADAHSGTSNLARNNTDQHGGTYCAELQVDSSDSYVYIVQTFDVTPGARVTLTFWYKHSTTGKTMYWGIRDDGSNVWLQDDMETWGADNTIIPSNQTDWTQVQTTFNWHSSYSTYRMSFQRNSAASSSIYIDDVSFVDAPDEVNITIFDLNPQPDSRKGTW